MIINGYINTYNIEQNVNEDSKALEIHELINNGKISTDIAKTDIKSIEDLLSHVKYNLTEENMIISNSFFAKVSYIILIIIYK